MNERAPKFSNPIESLTPEEKRRLGDLIKWAIDGPEQGIATNVAIAKMRKELWEFLSANGIHAKGQMGDYDELVLRDHEAEQAAKRH